MHIFSQLHEFRGWNSRLLPMDGYYERGREKFTGVKKKKIVKTCLSLANQHLIDQFRDTLSAIKPERQLSQEDGVQTAQIAWVFRKKGVQHQIVIHSRETKTDSLAPCLSRVFNVTDR